MEIAVDIGNSNIVIGFFRNEKWESTLRMLTKPDLEGAYYYSNTILNFLLEAGLKKEEVTQVGISSVVPELNNITQEVMSSIFPVSPTLIVPQHFIALPMQIEKPYQIGSDLVANSFAAIHLYKKSALVVDFGTALTFTVVSSSDGIIGVSIAPGLKTAIGALVGNTSQLPSVSLSCPESVIGKNTEHAIQAGVLWGYVSLVDGMISKIKEEYHEDLLVIATGGLSSVLEPLKPSFDHINKHLTLEGIRLLTQKIEA